jgi:hypothetical protein
MKRDVSMDRDRGRSILISESNAYFTTTGLCAIFSPGRGPDPKVRMEYSQKGLHRGGRERS